MQHRYSVRGVQCRERDSNKPAYRSLRRQACGGRKGVEAVARELLRRDIVADVAGVRSLRQQFADKVQELLLRAGNMLALMEERHQLGPVMAAVVSDECVGVEHRFEPLPGVAASGPDLRQLLEVADDMALVPGGQDRFDVRKIFVQGGAADPGPFSDLRHRDRRQPLLRHQRPGCVKDRLPHRVPVRVHRIIPQLRHSSTIRDGEVETIRT